MTRRVGFLHSKLIGLLALLGVLASACNGGGATPTPSAGSGTPPELYAAASATCASMRPRSTGKIYYFCDCQTGAQDGCVAGSDSNYATYGCDAAHPCQTWTQAITTFNAMNAGDTVALCKGGLWNLPAASNSVGADCGYAPHVPQMNNPRCAGGADLKDPANTSTCDIRDYQASWGGTNKPVLYMPQTYTKAIVRGSGDVAGVRVLNLEFRGTSPGPGYTDCSAYPYQMGIGIGSCADGRNPSWLVCNNTFANLRIGIQGNVNSDSSTSAFHVTGPNFIVWGNRFVMNDLDAILGDVANQGSIDANFFDNVGCFMHPCTGNRAHVIYLSGPFYSDMTDVQIVNNEIRRSSATSAMPGPSSAGPVVGHGYNDRFTVENNIIDCGENAEGGCWGIDLRASHSQPTHYRNLIIRRNWINTTGNGIAVAQAPGVIIENNVIVSEGPTTWREGIMVVPDATDIARTSVPGYLAGYPDDVSNNATVRNNTIYITGSGAFNGIRVWQEGTGHVIANNVIYQTVGTCFTTSLPAGSYTFVGNNACSGGASWGSPDYSATPQITAPPQFTNAPTDFTPAAGSPLIGAGSNVYRASVDFTGAARPSPPSIGAYEP